MADSNNIDNFDIQQENDFEKISAPGAAEMEQESADQPPQAQDGQVTSSEAAAAADSTNGEGDLEEQFNMVDGKEIEGLSPSSDPEPLVPLDADPQVASPAKAQAAENLIPQSSESQSDSVADPFMSVPAEVEAAAAAEALAVSENIKDEFLVSESQLMAPAEDVPPAEPFIQEPIRSESPKQSEVSGDPKPNLVDLDLISDAVADNTVEEDSSQLISSSAGPQVNLDLDTDVEPLVAPESLDVVCSGFVNEDAIDEKLDELQKGIESPVEEEPVQSVIEPMVASESADIVCSENKEALHDVSNEVNKEEEPVSSVMVEPSAPDLIAEDNEIVDSSSGAVVAGLAPSVLASAPTNEFNGPKDVAPVDLPSEKKISENKDLKEVSVKSNEEEAIEGCLLKGVDPRVIDLIYWRDVKASGVVFGSMMTVLLSLATFSLVSVLAYLSLALLAVSFSFVVYKKIMGAVQKSNDGHPFKQLLDLDIGLKEDKLKTVIAALLNNLNKTVAELRRLFLIEDMVDSLKFGLLLWVSTYIGCCLNGITLVILSLVALFSLPKVYETYQVQIDQNVGMVKAQINNVITTYKQRQRAAQLNELMNEDSHAHQD